MCPCLRSACDGHQTFILLGSCGCIKNKNTHLISESQKTLDGKEIIESCVFPFNPSCKTRFFITQRCSAHIGSYISPYERHVHGNYTEKKCDKKLLCLFIHSISTATSVTTFLIDAAPKSCHQRITISHNDNMKHGFCLEISGKKEMCASSGSCYVFEVRHDRRNLQHKKNSHGRRKEKYLRAQKFIRLLRITSKITTWKL